jgi:hypothetical protein
MKRYSGSAADLIAKDEAPQKIRPVNQFGRVCDHQQRWQQAIADMAFVGFSPSWGSTESIVIAPASAAPVGLTDRPSKIRRQAGLALPNCSAAWS